jgi:hypothetical protein
MWTIYTDKLFTGQREMAQFEHVTLLTDAPAREIPRILSVLVRHCHVFWIFPLTNSSTNCQRLVLV